MNELKNIITMFNDCELDIISNIDGNYAETGCEELYCVEEYVRIGDMLHPDYTVYINEEEDRVIFDKRGMEYLGYWR